MRRLYFQAKQSQLKTYFPVYTIPFSRDLQSYHSLTERGVIVGCHYGADGNAFITVCRMKKEAADTVFSLVAETIKENCIDGRCRGVLNIDRTMKTAPVKLHFECFAYQLTRLSGARLKTVNRKEYKPSNKD